MLVALGHLFEVALTNVVDDGRATSCVVVLGAAVWDGAPSPVYDARLRYAVERVRDGGVLVLTGGVGEGDTSSEAAVGAAYAQERGVSEERVFLEDRSRTTAENVAFARAILEARLPERSACALVSDPLHLPRALVLAEDAGLAVFPAATPYTRFTSVSARARLLVSEAWYLARHRATRLVR